MQRDKDNPPSSYKYFAHKWVRSQTTRRYISPYSTRAHPAFRRYKSMDEPSSPVVPSSSSPLQNNNNPRTRAYLSSLIPNPHPYVSPYRQATMASSTPSRNRGTKRARKNGAGKGNKVAVVPAPITQPSPQPQPPQPSQDPRYSLTYILNTPTPPIHPSTRTHTLPALPSKIRHLIWTYARSRTILITISNGRIFSRSPSPITFRINQESRSATLHHYSVHPHFYIPGTPYQNQNESEKIHYPFFDPSVDSVVLNQISTDHHPTLPFTSTIFEFYDSDTQQTIFGKRKSVDYTHFDILHSLHIPSRAWDWKRIYRAPRMDIRFRNLTEIVLEGGAMGLKTRRDVKKCKEFIRGCFERSVEEIDGEEEIDDDAERMDASSGIVGNARTAEMEIRVPEVRVIMPNGLDHEWMFEEDKLGMESIEERTWVMNFISKVKASR